MRGWGLKTADVLLCKPCSETMTKRAQLQCNNLSLVATTRSWRADDRDQTQKCLSWKLFGGDISQLQLLQQSLEILSSPILAWSREFPPESRQFSPEFFGDFLMCLFPGATSNDRGRPKKCANPFIYTFPRAIHPMTVSSIYVRIPNCSCHFRKLWIDRVGLRNSKAMMWLLTISNHGWGALSNHQACAKV